MININEATGKTHTLATLQDILNLGHDELLRLIPDLVAWHKVCRDAAVLMDVPVSDMNATMEWVDDGVQTVRAVDVHMGDYGTFDLLKIANSIEVESRE